MAGAEAVPENQVVLRFYGRFIYAVAKAGDRILALAPNFEEAKFGEHKPLMTVQRDKVIFTNKLTTLKPMLRLATDATILDGEFLVWDMSGFNIKSNVPDGPVSLTVEKGIVLKLPEIAGVANPTIKPQALAADKAGLSRAVITINRGIGVAQPVVEGSGIRFVTEKNMQQFLNNPDGAPHVKNPIDPTTDLERNPADLVEFVVKDPASEDGEESEFSVTFEFADAAGKKEQVTVRGGTKVAFSNMCASTEPAARPFDLEFREYYNFLSSSGDDRLIPAAPLPKPNGLIEGNDCDVPGIIAF